VTEIDLSAGTIDYIDTHPGAAPGDADPTLLFLHGALMDATLWDQVIADLSADHRCVAPTLPLGAHRQPMRDGADLTLPGIAALATELCERLDLRDVTVVGNDTGGALAQLLLADPGLAKPVARAVLVSCEAFDNFPPGLTGRTLFTAGKLPPRLFGAFLQQLRLKPARRLPISFGWLTRRGDAVVKGWLRPVLTSQGVRRDTVRMLRAAAKDKGFLVRAAERLGGFAGPVLVVWAARDRVMPVEHGRRLAALLPDARFVEVDDSYTLVPLDQPAVLAGYIRDFVRTTAG
jgi:pimeloyl-ACP methyl ester carboxylesterase